MSDWMEGESLGGSKPGGKKPQARFQSLGYLAVLGESICSLAGKISVV
jgi:hypothetical protein